MSGTILKGHVSNSNLEHVIELGFVPYRNPICATNNHHFQTHVRQKATRGLDKSQNWAAFAHLQSLFGSCGTVGATSKGDKHVLEVIQAIGIWISIKIGK